MNKALYKECKIILKKVLLLLLIIQISSKILGKIKICQIFHKYNISIVTLIIVKNKKKILHLFNNPNKIIIYKSHKITYK